MNTQDKKKVEKIQRMIRLERVRRALLKIDEQLNIIEQHDVYGDMIENFQDYGKGKRKTDRLVKMIDKDLAKLGIKT